MLSFINLCVSICLTICLSTLSLYLMGKLCFPAFTEKKTLSNAATSKNQIIIPKNIYNLSSFISPISLTYFSQLAFNLHTPPSHPPPPHALALAHAPWHLQTSLIRLIVWASHLHLNGQQLWFNSLLSSKHRRQHGRRCFLKNFTHLFLVNLHFPLHFPRPSLSSSTQSRIQSNLLKNKTNISLRAFWAHWKRSMGQVQCNA